MENQISATPERNRSIDVCRFVFATLAVVIHSGFLRDISEPFYDLVIFMLLGRYVVQTFICISGYYFFKALLSGKPVFKKQFVHLLKVYVLWTLIYYCASFVQSVLLNKEPLSTFLVERVVFFFTQGSYPHFWNFPATLYSMLIMTLVYRLFKQRGVYVVSLVSIGLFCVGALGSIYYTYTAHIPGMAALYSWDGFYAFRSIFLIGLPFFSMGYLLNRWQAVFARYSSRALLVVLGVLAALYVAEGIIAMLFMSGGARPESQFATYPLVMVLFLTLLRYPMPRLARFSELARRLANFIYFVHPLLIQIIGMGSAVVGIQIGGTPLFFIVQAVSMLAGYILVRINRRWSDALLGLPAKPRVQA